MSTIKHRRGSASEWFSANTTLAMGEFGVEVDTGKFKVGNGTSTWADLPYFSPGGTSYTDEKAQDAIAALIAEGDHVGITFVYDDENHKLSATAAGGYTNEQAQDAMATLFANGEHEGVTFTYNDSTNSFDVVVVGGYTTEQAQDAMAALFAAGEHEGIEFTYNDSTNSFDVSVDRGLAIYKGPMAPDPMEFPIWIEVS